MSESIELTNLSGSRDQLYLQAGRIEVNDTAARYRDITADEVEQEKMIKIGMVIGAVILATATIAAVACIAQIPTVVKYFHDRWGNIYIKYVSDAPFAVVPAFFGTGGVSALLVGAGAIDLERSRHGGRNLSIVGAAEQELLTLTSGDLEKVYQSYHCHGGSGPLVRHGLITVKEGDALSDLLKRYAEPAGIKKSYENQSAALKEDLAQHPKKYPNYKTVLEDIQKLEEEWKELQAKIQVHYAEK